MSHGFGDVSSKICYENVRQFHDGTVRTYPLFMMVGQMKV